MPVKFDNELMETICIELLTVEENRLKLVYLVDGSPAISISGDALWIETLKGMLHNQENKIKAIKKALLLCEIAQNLKAEIYDDEE
jgi:hypothetical protein